MAEGPLFSDLRLSEWLERRWRATQEAVDALPERDLLTVDPDAWRDKLVESVRVDPIELGEPEVEDLGEVTIDLSRRYLNRGWDDDIGPALAPGYRIRLHVPLLAGEADMLRARPQQFDLNPPHGALEPTSVTRTLEAQADREMDVSGHAAAMQNELSRWVAYGRPEVDAFNARLRSRVVAAIELRRKRSLSRLDVLQRSGLPIRQRTDAPRNYQAPGITRRPRPSTPSRSTAAPATMLEPVMIDDFYEHVLSVIRGGARGIERARGAFASLGEEDLRQQFLFTLNTHYEGAATGEAFNAEGKTDILVRVADRNVFIGECKFWSGAAGFTKTVDQLFGYTTWHDTKAALIIFVREKDLTAIVAKGKKALKEHTQFKRWRDAPEAELRCKMIWPGDPERAVDLSVHFVHLASATAV